MYAFPMAEHEGDNLLTCHRVELSRWTFEMLEQFVTTHSFVVRNEGTRRGFSYSIASRKAQNGCLSRTKIDDLLYKVAR